MSRASRSIVFLLASFAFLLLPTEPNVLAPEPALAVPSGALLPFPPNHDFEAGPVLVGDGPLNHDFDDGAIGWTKTGTGDVTYPAGIATITGSVTLRSSDYTLGNSLQAVKIRYKYPASAYTVAVYNSVGSVIGQDNLNCPIGCTSGSWVEKYIGLPTTAQGLVVNVRIHQLSGTTEVDYLGDQWISFQEWRGNTSGGAIKSQPKLNGSQLAEVRGTLRTQDFTLTENRLEFDYSFPLASGNSLTAYLHRASDNVQLSSKPLSGNGVSWTRVTDWNWTPSDYTGQTVYVRFVAGDSIPAWVDNVGINLVQAFTRENHPSEDAGDPFDTSGGQSTHSHTDILIPGKGIPLEFTRYYNSLAATPGALGYSWRHNYSTSLRVDTDQSVMVTYGSGGGAYFKYNAGSYTAPVGVYDTLVRTGSPPYTYTLTTKSQIRYEFTGTTPALTAMKDRNNNTTILNYTGALLTSVTDASTLRSPTFSYDGTNRIELITDPIPSPNARTVKFIYDSNGDLWKVKDVKAHPTNGPFTVYTYSNHRMVSLTDSNGHLQNENKYDGANRVVEQTDASGGKFCTYYGSAPTYTSPACPGVTPAAAAGQTIVVNPRGYKTTYDFDTKFRTTAITDHTGGVTTMTYDLSNNVTCVTDQRGKKTAYSYDSKLTSHR